MPEIVHVVMLRIKKDADPVVLRKLFDDINDLRKLKGVLGLDVGPAIVSELYPGYANRNCGELAWFG
jgi:hypothetical protein